jgi:acyl-CoA hydrolase
VTARADVHTVVTEHGSAELFGRSIGERIEALTAIADPRFRAELVRAVHDVRALFREHPEGE